MFPCAQCVSIEQLPIRTVRIRIQWAHSRARIWFDPHPNGAGPRMLHKLWCSEKDAVFTYCALRFQRVLGTEITRPGHPSRASSPGHRRMAGLSSNSREKYSVRAIASEQPLHPSTRSVHFRDHHHRAAHPTTAARSQRLNFCDHPHICVRTIFWPQMVLVCRVLAWRGMSC